MSAANATAPAEEKKLKPMRIGEIILRTRNFDAMKNWYSLVLGRMDPSVLITIDPKVVGARNDIARVCFFRVHMDYPFAMVVGLFEVPDIKAVDGVKPPGMDHIMLRDWTLGELFDRYEMLKAEGQVPTHAFNHGPGTSFYYRDPDGNMVELAAVNFPSEAEYLAYFKTEAYQKNFDGIRINPDEFVAKFRSGVSQAELVRIPA